MLKRKIYNTLLAWKNKKHQECLLVNGARQIGKSFIIRELGKNEYKSYIEINFYEHPEYNKIFDGDLTPTEIYKRISLQISDVKFIEHDTLIFLDEIQSIKFTDKMEMQGALKGYLESGEYRVGAFKGVGESGLVLLGNIDCALMDTEKICFQHFLIFSKSLH